MGRPSLWLAVEPSSDAGTGEIVAVIETEDGMYYRASNEDVLVFDGLGYWRDVGANLETVTDRVDRAVAVQNGGSSATAQAAYLERRAGSLTEVESIVSPASLDEQMLFDYFATEYEIHVPV